jgi:ASTRA-associated protein 1
VPADVRTERAVAGGEESDEEDEMNEEEKKARTRWLVGGGKDHRVSIWALMSFENSGT